MLIIQLQTSYSSVQSHQCQVIRIFLLKNFVIFTTLHLWQVRELLYVTWTDEYCSKFLIWFAFLWCGFLTDWNQSLYRFLSSSMVGVANDKLFVFRPQLSTVSLSSSVKTPLESSNQFYELRTFSLIDGRELFQRIVPSPLLFDFSTSGRKKNNQHSISFY
jgi:hypothetical protein